MQVQEKIEILERSLTLQLQWIASADSKSNYFFTLALAMLGTLAASLPGPEQNWPQLTIASVAVAGGLITTSIGCIIHAVFPRTEGPARSLIYCGSISDLGSKNFRDAVGSTSWESHLEDLTTQVFRNAYIASVKFQWVKRGVKLIYISTPAWIVAIWSLYSFRA